MPLNRGNCISRKIWVNGPLNFSRKFSCFNSKSKTSLQACIMTPLFKRLEHCTEHRISRLSLALYVNTLDGSGPLISKINFGFCK